MVSSTSLIPVRFDDDWVFLHFLVLQFSQKISLLFHTVLVPPSFDVAAFLAACAPAADETSAAPTMSPMMDDPTPEPTSSAPVASVTGAVLGVVAAALL